MYQDMVFTEKLTKYVPVSLKMNDNIVVVFYVHLIFVAFDMVVFVIETISAKHFLHIFNRTAINFRRLALPCRVGYNNFKTSTKKICKPSFISP